jgi:parvulin-like peptidyl-prolyl isomerase
MGHYFKKFFVLLVLILFFFLFFGCNQIENSENSNLGEDFDDNVVAVVNGEEIFQSRVEMLQDYFREYDIIISFEEALEEVILEVVLVQKASENNFFPSFQETELELEKELLKNNETLEEFKSELIDFGISYTEYVESLRPQFSIQKYVNSIIDQSLLIVSDAEIEEFYEQESQKYDDLPPLEEIKFDIKLILEEGKYSQELQKHLDELIENSNIVYVE